MPEPGHPASQEDGRCRACRTHLNRDDICAQCGLPIETSSVLDAAALGAAIQDDPGRNGAYSVRRDNLTFGMAPLAFGAFSALMLPFGIWVFVASEPPEGLGDALGVLVFLLVFLPGAVGGLRYGWARLWAGASVEEDGVLIRGPWQDLRVGWRDISRFDIGPHIPTAANPPVGVVVVLTDDRRIEIKGIRLDGFIWTERKRATRAALYAAALNRWLLAAAAGASSGSRNLHSQIQDARAQLRR